MVKAKSFNVAQLDVAQAKFPSVIILSMQPIRDLFILMVVPYLMPITSITHIEDLESE